MNIICSEIEEKRFIAVSFNKTGCRESEAVWAHDLPEKSKTAKAKMIILSMIKTNCEVLRLVKAGRDFFFRCAKDGQTGCQNLVSELKSP